MSMFRRPTEESSSSDSDGDTSEDETEVYPNVITADSQDAELTKTESLSSGDSVSFIESSGETSVANVEQHRNMMFASLLEDFYRTRAAELLNGSSPNASFNRQSPEVQPLARSLFIQASQALTTGGILPASCMHDEAGGIRKQYLTGFDTLGLQNIQTSDLLSARSGQQRISVAADETMALVRTNRPPTITTANVLRSPLQELAVRTGNISLMANPLNDMQLTTTRPQRSHYQSSFKEMRLLGKGGFGRVYQTYNIFDQREYAVKKIPLSPKLSQSYRERGQGEIASILREVQALAQLDHCNVVRYHATWIEEPAMSSPLPMPISRFPRPQDRRRRLLADKPASAMRNHWSHPSQDRYLDGDSHGINFEADGTESIGFDRPDWSFRQESHVADLSSEAGSDIFTDGLAKSISQEQITDDPFCYVLHVQMSMYPTTLAQYLAPSQPSHPAALSSPMRRHCYHLIPALRIMLGILCGLQYIHAHGLVHRDIKPGNIFLSSCEAAGQLTLPDGFQNVGSCRSCPHQTPLYVNPRIGDFGLVADLARDATEARRGSSNSSDKAVGTEYYRPSRNGQSNGRFSTAINEKLDVFALGVVMVELLCCCSTSMERLNMLKDLQQGRLPVSLLSNAASSGICDDQCIRQVRECILGMIEQDSSQRWSCQKVKECIEMILDKNK